MEMGLTEESEYEKAKTIKSPSTAKLEQSKYTFDSYHRIVFNKTGNITYYLPLSLALLMVRTDEECTNRYSTQGQSKISAAANLIFFPFFGKNV